MTELININTKCPKVKYLEAKKRGKQEIKAVPFYWHWSISFIWPVTTLFLTQWLSTEVTKVKNWHLIFTYHVFSIVWSWRVLQVPKSSFLVTSRVAIVFPLFVYISPFCFCFSFLLTFQLFVYISCYSNISAVCFAFC